MILPNATATFRDSGPGWVYWLIDINDPTGKTRSPDQTTPTFAHDVQGNPFDTDTIYLAASSHPILGDGLVPFRFDAVTGLPVIIGGSVDATGAPSGNSNAIGGYTVQITSPTNGQGLSFFTLPNGQTVLINTAVPVPTPDQVFRQEYTQNTNDSDGVYVPVNEPRADGQGNSRLPRVMGFERLLQYLFTGRSTDLLGGIAGLLLPFYQSAPDRGASFDKLALSGVQYADPASRQIDMVLAVEGNQYVVRTLTPAQAAQRYLSMLPGAALAEKVIPYLSGGSVATHKVVKRCEVQVPVPAPTSQKIALTGATDGQVIAHALETDKIEFGGAYSLNGQGLYQRDDTVQITDPTPTGIKLLTQNPFSGYIRLRNAAV